MPPYGPYNNMYYPQSVMPTAPQTSVQTTGTTPTPQSNNLLTVLVNDESEVDLYPLAPNTTVMLMSFEKGKFWIKSRGMNGVPQPTRVFDFKELATAPAQPTDTVSRKEFAALNEKIDKLIADLGGGPNGK